MNNFEFLVMLVAIFFVQLAKKLRYKTWQPKIVKKALQEKYNFRKSIFLVMASGGFYSVIYNNNFTILINYF